MDKLRTYQDLIKRAIGELCALINEQRPPSQVDCECVFDDDRGQYLLVKVGWVGSRRVRATTLHVRLRNDKIWIEEDMTEQGIASDLLAQGVPKDDIVLAFQSPGTRKYSEFAVA